jgi:hypothetical protein
MRPQFFVASQIQPHEDLFAVRTFLLAENQHSAMKHPRQHKRAPQTHPSASAVPSYHRILVKHGLIEKTRSIPDAYEVFLKVGADPVVQKLRREVARGNRMKHVPALYLVTAMALQGMTKQELEALKLRIEEKRV